MRKRLSIRDGTVSILALFLGFSGCGGGGGGGGDVKQTMKLNAAAQTPSEVSVSWTEHPNQLIRGYDLVRNGKSVFPSLFSLSLGPPLAWKSELGIRFPDTSFPGERGNH